ncbi:MAG: serine hydrolase domain-containing protein [Rhizobium sp.]
MAFSEKDFSRGKLDQAGFAADLEEKLNAGIMAGDLTDLHAVLVSRGGRLALERYYVGADESWGRQHGTVRFGPESLHDLRSVTKSVVSLLYGIALDKGLVPSPDASLLAQFPAYHDLAADPVRASLTIHHALTMTLGMEWDELRPYSDPENSEIAMENSPDRFRFILERPFVAKPGSRWIYSGGAAALIGALIERGSGMPLPDFARAMLFEPLGITDFEWMAGSDGVASAASGLRLCARDLLRIGGMILATGSVGDRRVVSAQWLETSFHRAIRTAYDLDYGYFWFLSEADLAGFSRPQPWIAGFGNGGQRLLLMPAADIAVVIFSGRYDAPDAWVTPARIWQEILLANVRNNRR